MPVAAPLLRILFVDDEPQVLEALRYATRRKRDSWESSFAVGAEAAMAMMAAAEFDVIVSDLRMPGTDGAGLLEWVRENHPCTARIVLSGYADAPAATRAAGVAHQLLSKPCDVERIGAAVSRARQVQELIHDPAVRALVGRIRVLPASPRVYRRLVDHLARPDGTLSAAGAILEEDPAVAAKVLQLVNSAFFGIPRTISSVTQAVALLGAELVKGVVLTTEMQLAFAGVGPVERRVVERVQRESFLMARIARRIAPSRGEEAFAAAILHDLGCVVLASGLPDLYAEIEEAVAAGATRHLLERERIGVSHAEIGAYLLGLWGLPFDIVEAVALHHEPARIPPTDRWLVGVVNTADALARGVEDPAFEILPAWREIAAAERAAGEGP